MQASSVAKMALSAQGPGQLFLPFDPEYLEVCRIMLIYDCLCWWAYGIFVCWSVLWPWYKRTKGACYCLI